jgi:hypothetical protein
MLDRYIHETRRTELTITERIHEVTLMGAGKEVHTGVKANASHGSTQGAEGASDGPAGPR